MLGLRERMEENGSAPGTGEAKRSAAHSGPGFGMTWRYCAPAWNRATVCLALYAIEALRSLCVWRFARPPFDW